METVDLEMNDLFDNEAVGEDEDVGMIGGRLPDFEEGDGPMRNTEEDGDMDESQQDGDEGVVANLQRLSKGAAKKRVMRPQPKLDAERLKTDRGLPILPRIFKDVKFKGRGHEADDLKLMMGKLEHWAHRLFPKMPFDEFNDRMEKLQAKKAVQNTLNRIRLDMPILDDEYVANYDQPDEDGDQGPQPGDLEPEPGDPGYNRENPLDDIDAEEAFEEMMRQERQMLEKRMQDESPSGSVPPGSKGAESDPWADLEEAEREMELEGVTRMSTQVSQSNKENVTPDKNRAVNKTDGEERTETQASGSSQSPTASQGLTPDVKARMEENRRRALEKRAARLGVPVSALMSPKQSDKTPSKADIASNSTPGTLDGTSPAITVNGTDTETTKHSESVRNQDYSEDQSEMIVCQGPIHENQNTDRSADDAEAVEMGADAENDKQTEEELLEALASDHDDMDALITNIDSHGDLNIKNGMVDKTDSVAEDSKGINTEDKGTKNDSKTMNSDEIDSETVNSPVIKEKLVSNSIGLSQDSEQVPLAGDI